MNWRWHNPKQLAAALQKLPRGVARAVHVASEALDQAGVRHALVGGIATAAHGYLRSTDDVDFLVGDEAFENRGIIITFAPGVPILVGDVVIDYIPMEDGEEFLEAALGETVVPVEALVYMKLKAGRRRDLDDVYQILAAGAAEQPIRNYLADHAPQHLPRFESLIEELTV
jgi:hypothetical protein